VASRAGLRPQSDLIIEDFAKCWRYLGQCGVMAKEMASLLEGETNINTEQDIMLKRDHLNIILSLVETKATIKTK
jgi:hypothetical protein